MITNRIKIVGFIFISCLTFFLGYSQEKELKYAVELNSAIATKNTLPFWLTANKFGAIPNSANTLVTTSIYSEGNKLSNKVTFSYKAAFTGYSAKETSTIFINELYGSLNYKNWQFDVGVKHDTILWEGLSSSNGNISKSTNARSFPGYNLQLVNYTQLPFAKKWLSVKGNYGDFLLNDKRSVENTLIHTKSLFFKSILSQNLALITGLNHYAQWAGTSSLFGKQPSGFKNYLRVITGSSGGSDALRGDQVNVLGNQLGSYLLQLNYKSDKINWNFYWSHLFEDRSGREMMNYPDGLYGLFIDFKKPKATISHLLTEFTYTKHQSGSDPHYTDELGYHAGSGLDNYFNNGVYQSGWTYFGNMIGSPYFTTNAKDSNGITPGIIVGDNRLMAFNIGIKGTIKNLQYKTLFSHTTYFGWFGDEYVNKPTQFSGLLEVSFSQLFKLPFRVTLGSAFDTGTYRSVNFGGSLKLSKRGIF